MDNELRQKIHLYEMGQLDFQSCVSLFSELKKAITDLPWYYRRDFNQLVLEGHLDDQGNIQTTQQVVERGY